MILTRGLLNQIFAAVASHTFQPPQVYFAELL